MTKIGKDSIKSKYSEYLKQWEWTWFCTFTTNYTLSVKSSRRLMDRFFQMLSEYTTELGYDRPVMFWGVEPFEAKDGMHLHALIKIHDDFKKRQMFMPILNLYQVATGNKWVSNLPDGTIVWDKPYNRIQLAKAKKGKGTGYITKYCVKKQNGKNEMDYDWYF